MPGSLGTEYDPVQDESVVRQIYEDDPQEIAVGKELAEAIRLSETLTDSARASAEARGDEVIMPNREIHTIFKPKTETLDGEA